MYISVISSAVGDNSVRDRRDPRDTCIARGGQATTARSVTLAPYEGCACASNNNMATTHVNTAHDATYFAIYNN